LSAHSDSTTRYILLGAPRTGAGWLGCLLQAHPEVACAGEVLSEDEPTRREAHRQYYGTEDWMLRPSPTAEGYYIDNPRHYLSRLWESGEVAGFRATYSQLDRFELWPICKDGCRVLHVVRNPLAALVSEGQARKFNVPWLPPRKRSRRSPPVPVEVEDARQRLRADAVGASRVETWCPRRLEVTYRQLVESPAATWKAVCEFLGVTVIRLPKVSAKCQLGSIPERISNWQELRTKIPRHELAQLEEDLF